MENSAIFPLKFHFSAVVTSGVPCTFNILTGMRWSLWGLYRLSVEHSMDLRPFHPYDLVNTQNHRIWEEKIIRSGSSIALSENCINCHLHWGGIQGNFLEEHVINTTFVMSDYLTNSFNIRLCINDIVSCDNEWTLPEF